MKRAALLAPLCLLVGAAQANAAAAPLAHEQVAAMTLPREQLGVSVKGFTIELPSGFSDNGRAADDSYDPKDTARSIAVAGRQYGFVLLYGQSSLRPLRTGRGAIDVGTSVEMFGTARQARVYGDKILGDLTKVRGRNFDGVILESHRTFRVRGVGHQAVGIRTSIRLGATRVYGTYVDFRYGRFLAEAAITRGDDVDVTGEVLRMARALDQRIRDVLAGRVRGPAPKLPRPATPGRPPGGPDLMAMTLTTKDVPAGSTVVSETYIDNNNAIASFDRDFQYQGEAAARTGLIAIRNETALLRSAAEAGGRMFVLRTIVTAPNAAATVAGSFSAGTGLPTRNARVDELRRSLGTGDESFAASISFDAPPGRVRIMLLYVRTDRVLSMITVTGAAPAFTVKRLSGTARAAAKRVAAGLGPRLIA